MSYYYKNSSNAVEPEEGDPEIYSDDDTIDSNPPDTESPHTTFSGDEYEKKKKQNEDGFSDNETESPDFKHVPRIPLGSINLTGKLGEGAFGQVFKGKWRNHAVALKTINLSHAKKNFPHLNKKDMMESLQWEVSRISTIKHPNCVQFYGIYQNKKNCRSYIVMEVCFFLWH
jgi:hypothetical protein